MKIYERKGLWRVEGKGRAYATKKDAETAAGLRADPIWPPTPEVREYDTLEEAMAAEDVEQLL